jgi:flotillin
VGFFVAIAIIGAIFAFFLYHVVTNLIYICSPNEVLVFSGGRYITGQGVKGYKIVKGGRALRIPFLEEVNRMDLTNMNIEVGVKGAFAKGGIPLNVEGIANVKIAGESPGLDNALQRLLGKHRNVVMKIAKETLEGYLRGVLATLTPEEVNENTQAFERELRNQAGEGFLTLGLTLDNLKIHSVTDDDGYLDAIGRVQGANLNRDNRIAESERRAESLIEQADARKRGQLAKIKAQFQVLEAETERRVRNAETSQTAWVAQEEGEVMALLTRAKAELDLQEARIAQMKHQLQAEVVTPAKADMNARIAQARGDAAPILAKGEAQATALQELSKQWHQAGTAAKDIFLLQKLEVILPTFLRSVENVNIDNVTMIQGMSGSGGGGNLPAQAIATVKALEAGGIDVPALLNRLTGGAPKQKKKTAPVGLAAPARTTAPAKAQRQMTPAARPAPAPRPASPPPPPAQARATRRQDLLDFDTPNTPPKARLIRKRQR